MHSPSVFRAVVCVIGASILCGCARARADGPAPQKLGIFMPGRVWCAALSPNGRIVVAVSGQRNSAGQVMAWDVPDGKLLWHIAEKEGARSAVFSPDGKLLAVALYEGTVRLLDPATGKERMDLRGLKDGVNGVAFFADGKALAAAALDGTVTVWDLTTGKKQRSWHGHPHAALSVAVSANGKTLVSVGGDTGKGATPGEGKIWDLATGEARATLTGHTSVVECVAISPDGKTVATSSWDWSVRLWDLATGTPLRTMKTQAGGAMSVQFSPDGKILAAVGCNLPNGAATVRLWDPHTGRLIRSITYPHSIASAGFSRDGKTIVTGCWDRTVRLWEVETGQERQVFTGGSLAPAAPSPGGPQGSVSSEQWCARLGSRDAREAYRALWVLTDRGDDAVAAIMDHVRRPTPQTHADPARTAHLIAALDDDQVAIRESASEALGQLGKSVAPNLRRALQQTQSAEVDLRLRLLLDQMNNPARPSPLLIRLRAIEALEHIGTARARASLLEMEKAPMEQRVRDEARAALERLKPGMTKH